MKPNARNWTNADWRTREGIHARRDASFRWGTVLLAIEQLGMAVCHSWLWWRIRRDCESRFYNVLDNRMTQPVNLANGERFYPCWIVTTHTGNAIAGFLVIQDCKSFLFQCRENGESLAGWTVIDNRDHLPTYGETYPADRLWQARTSPTRMAWHLAYPACESVLTWPHMEAKHHDRFRHLCHIVMRYYVTTEAR